MSTQINLRLLSACSLFASTEEMRYYLQGVLVQCHPDHVMYIATDGHKMVVARENVDKDAPLNTLLGDFIIPLLTCRTYKPAKGRHYPALERATLTLDGEELRLRADVGTAQIFKPVDGTFPDWQRVFPRTLSGQLEFTQKAREGTRAVTYNPKFIADFVKLGELLNIGAPRIAYNSDGPAGVLYTEDYVAGILMPVTCSRQSELQEQWEARKAFLLAAPAASAASPMKASREEVASSG